MFANQYCHFSRIHYVKIIQWCAFKTCCPTIKNQQVHVCGTNVPDIEYLPSFHSPLPADGDVYCSGVDPILVPTDSITASHHFVACQHLEKQEVLTHLVF